VAISKSTYPETPGRGVMYWQEEEKRKHAQSPDFQGFIVLECDYRAGEKLYLGAWQKPTSRGNNLLSLKEDNWVKKKRMEEQGTVVEVRPAYATKVKGKQYDDDDVPF
jgi:hypothetical protein